MNPENTNKLILRNLTKRYGNSEVLAVDKANLEVKGGEVFGFLGPNGAGKSTTIRHLMGFSHPDKGNTKILGKDSFKEYSSILNNVGYIPGEIALPQGLNGYEFIKTELGISIEKEQANMNEVSIGTCAVKETIK